MKHKVLTTIFSFFFLLLLFVSCKKDKEVHAVETILGTKTINGRVQKGPYKNGASLIIYELNNSLGQTGKSFSSTINDDAGSFSLNNINLSSNYVLLTASGYYFNEHFNNISEGQLYLEAFADVSNISTINVNILTHIIKPRIEHLISTGLDFSASRTQAQNELLAAVGTSVSISNNFEALDLSSDGFLFAMSLLFQRNNSFGYQGGNNYTAELSGLLSNFRNDFSNNGIIDNQSLIDTLKYNVQRIDLIDTKIDMQSYYSGLGLTFSTTNFEQYIYAFQKKYSAALSSNIAFPNIAPIMVDGPGVSQPYPYVTNVIQLNQRIFSNSFGGEFSISAIVPYDSNLVIKITAFNSAPPIFSNFMFDTFGWKFEFIGNTYIYTAQRKNVILSAHIKDPSADSCKVEYFNSLTSTTPYLTRNVVFN